MRDQSPGHVYVKLLAFGEQNADHPFRSESLRAESRSHGAVFSPGYGHYGVAAGSVLIKPVSYPLNNIILNFFSVKFHGKFLLSEVIINDFCQKKKHIYDPLS